MSQAGPLKDPPPRPPYAGRSWNVCFACATPFPPCALPPSGPHAPRGPLCARRFQPLRRMAKMRTPMAIRAALQTRYPDAFLRLENSIMHSSERLAEWRFFRPLPKVLGLDSKQTVLSVAETFLLYKVCAMPRPAVPRMGPCRPLARPLGTQGSRDGGPMRCARVPVVLHVAYIPRSCPAPLPLSPVVWRRGYQTSLDTQPTPIAST